MKTTTTGRGRLARAWPCAAALLACASPSASGGPAGATASASASPCPLDVPDTRAVAHETPSGYALTFATDPANVDAVRERVRLLASFYNMHHDPTEGPAASGLGARAEIAPGAIEPLPPSRARARDVEEGALLEVTPLRGVDVQRLRREVQLRWGGEQPTSCPSAGW
ncbi:MAG TPA: hypothetical protein VFP65_13280 [Anaeromyxobacteraceae bacterium]|nr:hypothetical protein [Anaeromyxobacteraceae bacterium]